MVAGRQREQARTLFVEHLSNGPLGPSRMRALVRGAREEVCELRVAMRDGMECACREETLLEIADGALDLSLLVRLARRAERGLHVEMSGEIEERGMEANGVAGALDDDGLGVVEEPLSRGATEERRRTNERTPKRLDTHVDDELGPHRARVREDHHECPERPAPAGNGERSDVRPVDLCLLAGQALDAQEDLALRHGSRGTHVSPQRLDAAGVSALAEHVEDARRDELRIATECLVDERYVRLEHARIGTRRAGLRSEASEHAHDGVEVHAELLRDGAAFPVLGVIQPPDLGGDGGSDRHRATSDVAS
jgi:hypothetical protein